MLKLNYYFIDVGENSCKILERNFLLSLRDMLREKDIPRAELIKVIVSHNFKRKNPLFSENDFKIVFVNKQDKKRIKAEIVDLSTNHHLEPVITCKRYYVFIVQPGQRLDIECQVRKNEVEIRALRYENILQKKR